MGPEKRGREGVRERQGAHGALWHPFRSRKSARARQGGRESSAGTPKVGKSANNPRRGKVRVPQGKGNLCGFPSGRGNRTRTPTVGKEDLFAIVRVSSHTAWHCHHMR